MIGSLTGRSINSPILSKREIFETDEDLAVIFERENLAERIDPVKEPKKKGKKRVKLFFSGGNGGRI